MEKCIHMPLPITHPPIPLSPLPLPSPTTEGSMSNDYLAWFDGACQPVNPGGTATYGVMIKDQAGNILVWEHGLVGKGSAMSNNLAEYAGVLHILKYLSTRPPGRATVHGDSNLVINQLNGRWRIRKGLYLTIAVETKALLAYLHDLGWLMNFCWIPREQNEECDELSKKGCHAARKPSSTQQRVQKRRDPRKKSMLGRTIKTTGITVLRAAPSKKQDWWVCKCRCGREFTAHGWNVRHGRARDCGSNEHNVLSRGDQPTVLAVDNADVQSTGVLHSQSNAIPPLLASVGLHPNQAWPSGHGGLAEKSHRKRAKVAVDSISKART
jgi:ribonuclease HI